MSKLLNFQNNACEEVLKIFDYSIKQNVEYGGYLLMSNEGRISISVKVGQKFSISLSENDILLISTCNIIIGTWHTHPFTDYSFPSSTDLAFWNSNSPDYYHIIISKQENSVFTRRDSEWRKYELEKI